MSYTEAQVVERPIIEWLIELGWKYLPRDEVMPLRTALDEPLLIDNLKTALTRINKVEFTQADLSFIIASLRALPANIEGIRRFLDIIKNGLVVPLEKEKKVVVIKVIDFENVENNEFLFTNQFIIEGPGEIIRTDILLFINGIPIVLIEGKNPTIEEISWLDAYTQIKRYEKTDTGAPDLFKYVQFSIATDGIKTYYFPNSFAEESKDLLAVWRDPYPFKKEDFGDNILKITVYGMLSKRNLLNLLENFVFIRKEKDRYTKVMARYMQFRAADKIAGRVISTLRGEDNKKSGLIWHWQGSGKTYTMAFSSFKLHRSLSAANPTIFVVVDRKDLEKQIEEDFASLEVPVERIESISRLIEVLRWGGEGKRGIFLTTIEKFRSKEFEEAAKAGKIELTRENIVVLADETHRTHYGSLAIVMRGVLKNAFIFGFTGTPLSKPERNTFAKFSPPGELYLDRYTMLDAQEDGFTVPLTYEARLPEYHLDRKQLEELEEYEEELIEELTPEEKRELRKKFKIVNAVSKNPERIRRIAKDIAEHFRNIVEPTGLKAMIVTIDREACVMYRDAINNFLPPNYSETVMTFNPNDKDIVKDCLQQMQAKYGTKDVKEIHYVIIENFKTKSEPKILIVTDMLITGFDAPNLWVMYLDKPLKEHRTLQAVARTNRPFSNKKYGLICDYVGILKDLERAFRHFEAEDIRNLKLVIRDLSIERQKFENLLENALQVFAGEVKKEDTYESLEAALHVLIDPGVAKGFENTMKQLMKSFEMLSGDPYLLKYFSDYKWMVKIYVAYYRKFKKANVDEMKIADISKKTYSLVQETIDMQGIERKYPILTIDEDYLEVIRRKSPSGISAAIDIIADIQNEARQRQTSPFFGRISDQVRGIYEELRLRKAETKDLISRLLHIAEQIAEWKREEKEIGSDRFAIYETLKSNLPEISKEAGISFATKLLERLRDQKLLFKSWQQKKDVRRKVKEEIRVLLLGNFKEARGRLDELTENLFRSLEAMRWKT
jgi:type I restriction enzyme R subunit